EVRYPEALSSRESSRASRANTSALCSSRSAELVRLPLVVAHPANPSSIAGRTTGNAILRKHFIPRSFGLWPSLSGGTFSGAAGPGGQDGEAGAGVRGGVRGGFRSGPQERASGARPWPRAFQCAAPVLYRRTGISM